MEILEHGKTYQVYTCPRCKCVFAACEKDVPQNPQTWSGHPYLVCPECREEIELKEMK